MAKSYREDGHESTTKQDVLKAVTKYVFQSIYAQQLTTELKGQFVGHEDFKVFKCQLQNNTEHIAKEQELQRNIRNI